MRVQALHVYPVKGAAGTARETARFGPKGLADDRCWMVVDADGVFVSQRELAQLALLGVAHETDGIRLSVPGHGEVFAPRPDGAERRPVAIWNDTVDAAFGAVEADTSLTRWLRQDVRLAFFDGRAARSVSRDWIDRDAPVAFADGFPMLVTSIASLAELNRQMSEQGGEPVPMDRFRPNIVIEGAEPFAEDGWQSIAIGGAMFDLVKPCARCVVTTIDQASGTRSGKEPLATLARTHRSGDRRAPGALFGWNVVPRGEGELRVGDAVEVVAQRATPWPIA